MCEDMRPLVILSDEDPDPGMLEYPNFLLKVRERKLKQTEDSFIVELECTKHYCALIDLEQLIC